MDHHHGTPWILKKMEPQTWKFGTLKSYEIIGFWIFWFSKKHEQSRLPDSWSITWCASWLAGPWIVLHMFAIKSWKIQRIPFLMCSKGISSYLCWEFRCWIMLTLTIGRSVCMPFYHVAAVALLPILARKSPDEFSNETSKTMEGERSR